MATMDTGDVAGAAAKLQQVEAGLRGECIENMLRAGGEVVAKSWENTIVQHNHVTKGRNSAHMAQSVKVTNIQLELGGGTATVMPDGYDDNGVAQALKAWAINAGAGYIKKKDPFVKAAETAAHDDVVRAMEAVLDDYITKG